MNKAVYYFRVLILLLSISIAAVGQEITVSGKTETIQGKKYFIHKVEKGQTLYSIAKAYRVTTNDIEKENPSAASGLAPGMELRIPQVKEPSPAGSVIQHTVEKEQTLYAISRKYNVSIEQIKALNPEMAEGIRPGQVLQIPVSGDVKVSPEKAKTSPVEKEDNLPPVTESAPIKADVVKSTRTEVIDGKKYYLHTIEKGQTLYAISKAYGISSNDLVSENPQLVEGLKVGQTIRIPADPTQTVSAAEVPPGFHKVKKSETVNSICRDYQIQPEDLYKVNPELVNGLKEGSLIRIPPVKPATSTGASVKKEFSPGKAIHVALLLPFYLAKNDTSAEYLSGGSPSIYPKSVPAVEFYQGYLLSLDSLKKAGIEAKVTALDMPEDVTAQNKFLNETNWKEYDLIIGPFQADDVALAAAAAKKNGLCLVAPFSQQAKPLLGNGLFFKATPSAPTQAEQIASLMARDFQKQNIMVLHNGLPKEKNLLDSFLARFRELSKGDSVRVQVYKTSGFKGAQAALSKTKKNVIYFISNDQAIVTDFINKLQPLCKDYDITLIGLESWGQFENLDVNFLHDVKLHVPVLYFIDYSQDPTKRFVSLFRRIYKSEPSRFAFMGFDLGLYFTRALAESKGDLPGWAPENPKQMLSAGFNFYRSSPDSGFENRGVIIVKYENFSLVRVQ